LPNPQTNLIVSDLFAFDPNSQKPYWNAPLLEHLFDTNTVREIQKISISSTITDPYLWTLSTNGLFSTKTAYKTISNPRSSSAFTLFPPYIWKSLWKLNLMDRLKLFLWKIAWDIIPSKIRINAVFPTPLADLVCPLCNVEEDSLNHLFFRCVFARIAWRSSHWPLDFLKWSSLNLPNWIKGILSPHQSFSIPLDDTQLFQIYVAVLCDMLWLSRNKAIHKGVIPNVTKFAEDVLRISLEHQAAWIYKSQPIQKSWSPP
jgi:hypothetical protein